MTTVTPDAEETSESPIPPRTRTQRLTLVATGLGLFMIFLDAMIVNVALPDIRDDLGGGESALQWIVASYSLTMAMFIMSAATLADRFGRRKVYIVGLVIFTGASLACALAPSTGVLVATRGLQGVGAAMLNVASLALVSAAFTDKRAKAKAIALWMAIATLGLALGPTAGGIITEFWDWRGVFLVNVPVGILAMVLTVSSVKETRDPEARSLDWGGQALFIVGFGAIAYVLIGGPQQGWLSAPIIALMVLAVVALGSLVIVELRIRQPMMDLRLFRDAGYTSALIFAFVVLACAYGMILVITQYLQNVLGYSALVAGAVILGFSIPGPFSTIAEGRWAVRVGPRRPAVTGMLLVAIGLAVLVAVIGTSVYLIPVGLFIMGVGVGQCVPSVTTIAMETVPDERAGMASGMLSAQRGIGSTVGFAIMGSLVAVWLGAFLNSSLDDIVPDATERADVTAEIIDSVNPNAYVGLPGEDPLPSSESVTRSEIAAAADTVYANGVRVALGAGAVAAGLTALIGGRFLPSRSPSSTPARKDEEAEDDLGGRATVPQ